MLFWSCSGVMRISRVPFDNFCFRPYAVLSKQFIDGGIPALKLLCQDKLRERQGKHNQRRDMLASELPPAGFEYSHTMEKNFIGKGFDDKQKWRLYKSHNYGINGKVLDEAIVTAKAEKDARSALGHFYIVPRYCRDAALKLAKSLPV